MKEFDPKRKVLFSIRQGAQIQEDEIREVLKSCEGITVSPILGERVVFERDEHGIKHPYIYPEIRGICRINQTIDILKNLDKANIVVHQLKTFDPERGNINSFDPWDDVDYRDEVIKKFNEMDGEQS